MAKYPTSGETVRVGDVQEAATALRSKEQKCHRHSKEACLGFEREAKAAMRGEARTHGELDRTWMDLN